MNIVEMLFSELKKAEPNVLGNRHAILEVDGDEFIITEKQAASRHNGSNSWGRVTFRKNGKVIAKKDLVA